MINAGKGLKARGHDVTIACLSGSVIEKNARSAGLDIYNFSIGADIAFWKIGPLRRYLRLNNIDILVCCQNKDVKIGARAGRMENLKGIFARQGLMNIKNKKSHRIPFTRHIDGIITNTNSIKEAYLKYGWFTPEFIHVIYNGVEVPEGLDTVDLHQLYDLPPDSKVIISAGRLDHQKGFDLLVRTARLAKEQKLNWSFLIVGKGKLHKELEKMASEEGVEDIFKLAGFSSEVPVLLRSADVFVLPSRYEGMPNALLEAMAVGKASVATKVNGAPELIEDHKSGFLSETENYRELFDHIKEILENEKLKSEIEKRAKARVSEMFSIDQMINRLESLFASRLGK